MNKIFWKKVTILEKLKLLGEKINYRFKYDNLLLQRFKLYI